MGKRLDKAKEGYATWKKWMESPRYSALAKLGFWIVFFVIIYLIVTLSYEPATYAPKNQDPPKTETTIENVEYIYKFTYQEVDKKLREVTVKGTFFDDKYYFAIGNKEYYDDGKLYLVDGDARTLTEILSLNVPLSRDMVSAENLLTWIDESTLEEEIEYKDDKVKISKYYYKLETGGINIDVIAKEETIASIEINLIDMMSTKDVHYEKYSLTVVLENVNNIASYERNFSEYTIITEGE